MYCNGNPGQICAPIAGVTALFRYFRLVKLILRNKPVTTKLVGIVLGYPKL